MILIREEKVWVPKMFERVICNQLIDKFSSFRVGIRACVVMIPLLGVTWLFGLLSPLHKAFSYIFTILNSTQVSIKYYLFYSFIHEIIHIECLDYFVIINRRVLMGYL